jgi:hypothetical protein
MDNIEMDEIPTQVGAEHVPDPEAVRAAVAVVTRLLRQERRRKGEPSLREMAAELRHLPDLRSVVSVSTLRRVLVGADTLPRWRAVAGALHGMGASERAWQEVQRAWRAAAELVNPVGLELDDPPEPSPVAGRASRVEVERLIEVAELPPSTPPLGAVSLFQPPPGARRRPSLGAGMGPVRRSG